MQRNPSLPVVQNFFGNPGNYQVSVTIINAFGSREQERLALNNMVINFNSQISIL